MPSRKSTRVAALVLTLLLAVACSSPQGTEQAENSLLGQGKERASGAPGSEKKGGGAKGRSAKPGGDSGAVPTAPGGAPAIASPGETGKTGFSGASKTETEVSSTGTDPRNATVTITEPDPDADTEGVAPEFADILSTRVQGAGANLQITITFRGELPQKMPDDKTYMVAGFGMTGPKGESQGYAFGASADTTGWRPYGRGKEKGDFPGKFSVSGDTVTFTVPWKAVRGPRPFEWYAQSSWFKSLAGTTHYSLDALPNDGPAEYPAG